MIIYDKPQKFIEGSGIDVVVGKLAYFEIGRVSPTVPGWYSLEGYTGSIAVYHWNGSAWDDQKSWPGMYFFNRQKT